MTDLKTKDLDDDIKSLKEMLDNKDLKFGDKMKVYAQLQKLYNLRLRYSGTGRGGAYTRPTGSQS